MKKWICSPEQRRYDAKGWSNTSWRDDPPYKTSAAKPDNTTVGVNMFLQSYRIRGVAESEVVGTRAETRGVLIHGGWGGTGSADKRWLRRHGCWLAGFLVSKTRNLGNLLKIKKWHWDEYIRSIMHANKPTKRAQNSQEAGIVSPRTHPLYHIPVAKFTVSKTRNLRNLLKIKKMALRRIYSVHYARK